VQPLYQKLHLIFEQGTMKLRKEKSNMEQELARLCKKNNAKAQKQLYEHFSPRMLAVVNRYIKDKSEAESTMVKGFMVVFDKIKQYNGEGSLEGWIRRIMINESLMYLRKNKNMYLEVDITEAKYETNFETASSKLEVDDLLKMVQELPVGYRTIFNLYVIEGFNHKEIAEKLGINENTSKSQLSRARALLQKYIEQELNDISEGVRHDESTIG